MRFFELLLLLLNCCVVIKLLRLHWTLDTGKWSLKCTYRKMKTESIISFSTRISQFSINKWFLRIESLQRMRAKYTTKKWAPFLIFGRHFCTAAKLRERRQNTIGRSVLAISVHFSVGVHTYITYVCVFKKNPYYWYVSFPFYAGSKLKYHDSRNYI